MTIKITRVCFTYALPDGLWIEREDGTRNWEHDGALYRELGPAELTRLSKIAHTDGMTGMWHNADNGHNVFVNGQEVN